MNSQPAHIRSHANTHPLRDAKHTVRKLSEQGVISVEHKGRGEEVEAWRDGGGGTQRERKNSRDEVRETERVAEIGWTDSLKEGGE